MSELRADDRFEQSKTRFFEGLGSYQAGRYAEAEQHYLASLALLPGRVSTLVNLAATQLELARPADALAATDQVLAVEPDNADAWFHRGTALCQLERLEDALAAFERLLAIDGRLAEGWHRHAQTLERLGRPVQALASYERVLAIDPTNAQAWSGRGTQLRELQRPAEAAHAFRQALQHGADSELHSYYLASVEGRSVPPTAPKLYVQALFDQYAHEFDEHLVGRLRYEAHRLLVEPLHELGRGPYASALDLGCGTGLCGSLVRPLVGRLTGLDVSIGMLERARDLAVYNCLEHAELLEYLQSANERHDLVLAADVFIYIGELAPVFAAVRRVMDSGVFCFSAERLTDLQASYRLLPSLRYAHTEAYLRGLAAQHRFDVLDVLHRPIRQDQGRPIDGLYFYLSPA